MLVGILKGGLSLMKKVSAVLSVFLLALIFSQGLMYAANPVPVKTKTPTKYNFGPKHRHPEKKTK